MATTHYWGVSKRTASLSIVSLLVILPFLVYYLSVTRFYRRGNSKASGKRPPTVPYYFPGAYHLFGLAYEGPEKFFGTVLKEYGFHSLFTIKAGLRCFVVVRDPKHITHIIQTPKQSTSTTSRVATFGKVFGSSYAALKLYGDRYSNEQNSRALRYAHMALPEKHLTGAPLIAMTDIYIQTLSRNLDDKMFQFGTWTQVEDFWSFFQQVVTRCIMATLFGSNILKQYPGLVKDYWKFDDAVEGFMPGMPRLSMSAAYEAPRDRLHQGIEKWLKANHSGSEFTRIANEDPIWDEYRGSKFIQERDDVLAKAEDLDFRARTAEILSVMHGSNSTLVPATLWMIIETLRRPNLVKHLAADISQHTKSGQYNIAGIAGTALFQSLHMEVNRLRLSTCTIRDSEAENIRLDDQWVVPKESLLVVFSQDISMNARYWDKASPRTFERPLDEFWAERFIIPDKKDPDMKKKVCKNEEVVTGNFSMRGLELLEVILSGDSYLSLGQDYVKAVQAATLVIFLTKFDLQLCDPGVVMHTILPLHHVAFGIAKPLTRIAVRIRKRKT